MSMEFNQVPPALLMLKCQQAHVKMSTIDGILTFISMINTFENSKQKKVFIFQHFSFYGQLKIHAQWS